MNRASKGVPYKSKRGVHTIQSTCKASKAHLTSPSGGAGRGAGWRELSGACTHSINTQSLKGVPYKSKRGCGEGRGLAGAEHAHIQSTRKASKAHLTSPSGGAGRAHIQSTSPSGEGRGLAGVRGEHTIQSTCKASKAHLTSPSGGAKDWRALSVHTFNQHAKPQRRTLQAQAGRGGG